MSNEIEKKPVLVVDDEELIGGLFKDILEVSGYSVHLCYHPVTALEKLKSIPVNDILAVIDFQMPIMNGVEFAKKAAVLNKIYSVMFVTANPELAKKETAGTFLRQAPIIAKPFDHNKLLNTIENISIAPNFPQAIKPDSTTTSK